MRLMLVGKSPADAAKAVGVVRQTCTRVEGPSIFRTRIVCWRHHVIEAIPRALGVRSRDLPERIHMPTKIRTTRAHHAVKAKTQAIEIRVKNASSTKSAKPERCRQATLQATCRPRRESTMRPRP